jgi:glycerol kinase
LLGIDCVRPQVIETTGLGSALLAGLAVGVWHGLDGISAAWTEQRRFRAQGSAAELAATRAAWAAAVAKA